ncbi:hypothetical protein N7486_008085 [Penicillium sp. IBT 16267x]|nr:hypothetical protein N7486_008085 [Penicillium sp. IBT 16267x]
MFGRRKRSSSHQPLPTPASQSAQSAASHAFLKSQPSTSSLSSAAAAAALRNRTPTPTSVENVQTKRMVQRATSTHSPRGTMSSRRSASVSGPLRRSNSSSSMTARTFREPSPHRPSTSSGPVPVHRPVEPPLPGLPAQYAQRKEASRRATSLEPSMRSPPASPPRVMRGVSSDRGGASSSLHSRVSSLSTVPEVERPGSRNSVNFSYPRGTRPNSPPLTPTIPENQPISLGAVVDSDGAQGADIQPTTPEKPNDKRPKVQAAGGSHASNVAGPSVDTAAAAAAQAISTQKSSPRADPSYARVESLEHEPSSISSPDNAHPSSRTAPETWPAAVREIEPEDNAEIEGLQRQDSGNRLAATSPSSDRVDTLVTPQSSPSAAKGLKDQEVLPHQSNSPGRSAHFSKWLSVSSSGDQIHQPPARSVSPVKSALKHPRGSSLSPDRKVSLTGPPVHPPGEMSDGTSVASDDGFRLNVKKRAPKVSFDDEAEIVGFAASPPTSPEEYTPGSPPKTKSRMSWLGVGKKKQGSSDLTTRDDDFGAVLKPRPILPSFGSVRGHRDGGPQEPAIPEYSDNESSSSSDNEVVAAPVSFSNDHAIGGILPKVRSKDPHNVNSVEKLSVGGESSLSQPKAATDKKLDGMAIGGITKQPPFNHSYSNKPPPSIAVEPATPPIDGDRSSRELQRASRSSLENYHIPGGFPPSASDRNLRSTAESTKMQPVASAVPKHVDDVDTEGESGDSVYSDAEEGFDGDGFGSINAIVDSKSIPRSSVPLDTVSESRDATPRPVDRTAVIDDASQDITEQAADDGRVTPTQASVNREVEEYTATVPVLEETEPPSPTMPLKSQARGVTNGTIQSSSGQQKRPISVDAYGTSSLNDPRYARAAPSASAGNGKTRTLSLGPAFQRTGGPGEAGFPSSFRRTRSSGSDSSSSFKRASHSPRNDGSRAMRRTMRAGASIRGPPSDRTDSPTDRRPMSSGSSQGPGTMRKTLRGPPGGGNERYSFFSTNKKAAPSPRARSSKAPKSMAGSRFIDSDGEDEGQQQFFHSRFADSSDEEQGPNSMRPVRGIPRRHGAHDGDSTDLDDSSEGERRQQSRPVAVTAPRARPTPPASRDRNAAPNMSGLAAVARQRGMTQQELEEFIMQPRKQGLLTRLGLKKSKNPQNRIRKADTESPSRRDTHLERSQLEREQVRAATVNRAPAIVTTVTANRPQSPSSPQKLTKKDSKRHTMGEEPWSFRSDARPQSIPEQSASAPSSLLRTQKPALEDAGRNGNATINGAGVQTMKAPESPQAPRVGPNVIDDAASDITMSIDDTGPMARNVVIVGSGRKKRFPMLRKAFGLRA